MATKLCRTRAFASALRSANPSPAVRCFSVAARRNVATPANAPNPRGLPREPEGSLKAPVVNPADKYASKSEDLHRYGSWIMGCLPKFVQQISVWKDELTIYISPSGVIPVFSFLKCMEWLQYEPLPPSLFLPLDQS